MASLTYTAGDPSQCWPEGMHTPGNRVELLPRDDPLSILAPSLSRQFSPILQSSSMMLDLRKEPGPMITLLPIRVALGTVSGNRVELLMTTESPMQLCSPTLTGPSSPLSTAPYQMAVCLPIFTLPTKVALSQTVVVSLQYSGISSLNGTIFLCLFKGSR